MTYLALYPGNNAFLNEMSELQPGLLCKANKMICCLALVKKASVSTATLGFIGMGYL